MVIHNRSFALGRIYFCHPDFQLEENRTPLSLVQLHTTTTLLLGISLLIFFTLAALLPVLKMSDVGGSAATQPIQSGAATNSHSR